MPGLLTRRSITSRRLENTSIDESVRQRTKDDARVLDWLFKAFANLETSGMSGTSQRKTGGNDAWVIVGARSGSVPTRVASSQAEQGEGRRSLSE